MDDFLLTLLIIPALVVIIDTIGHVVAIRPRGAFAAGPETPRCTDYTMIVPIYGKISFLENVDYLRPYGDKVLLVTSRNETPEFNWELLTIAAANGFRTHVSAVDPSPTEMVGATRNKRAVGGTLRDTIVKDAHVSIDTEYVVCIDADTTTEISMDYLIGAMQAANLDLVSVRLVPANNDTLIARLQVFEYAMAMRMRMIMPWLVSGGCHAARREVHRTLMHKHSLFFQGNDVELGVLAKGLGYKVGHVMFDVPTTVPNTIRSWWRQRRAWAGGEFRLMVVNLPWCLRHPVLYLYGAVVVFGLLPTRYYYLTRPRWSLLVILGIYLAALTVANWRRRTWELLLYPFYSLIYTLILIPFGILSYAQMAYSYRNLGLIRRSRPELLATARAIDLAQLVEASQTGYQPRHRASGFRRRRNSIEPVRGSDPARPHGAGMARS